MSRAPLRATFAALLERFHVERHTGPVIVHFAEGHANVIEVPGEPTRIVVDKGVDKGASERAD